MIAIKAEMPYKVNLRPCLRLENVNEICAAWSAAWTPENVHDQSEYLLNC